MSHLGKSFASTLQKCINVQHLIDPRRFGSSHVVLAELLFECLKTRTDAKEKDTMKERERPGSGSVGPPYRCVQSQDSDCSFAN